MTQLAAAYAEKRPGYFSGARTDIVALLPRGPHSILELGCGDGSTGRLALETGNAARYVGVELDRAAAEIAAMALSEVVVGDVETLSLKRYAGSFDALIVSEVFEHLTDPWNTLRTLLHCLKPGALVFASSPNIAHWRVIANLLRGRFDYADEGVMDRTHLRWFTPATYRAMFEAAGVKIDRLGAVGSIPGKSGVLSKLACGRLDHLLMSQVMLQGHKL